MTFSNQIALINLDDLRKLVEEIQQAKPEKVDAGPVCGLGVKEAAKFLGVSRRKFYYLLAKHPELAKACFYIGRRRLWRSTTLEDWAKRQEGKSLSRPESKEAA